MSWPVLLTQCVSPLICPALLQSSTGTNEPNAAAMAAFQAVREKVGPSPADA